MSIEVGEKVTGTVSGITNFGAFIDLGDRKTGLVHISEVSDSFIKDIKDVLKVGEQVTVKVMSIGDDGKIGLSIRRAVDKPAEPAAPVRERTSSYQGRRDSNSTNSSGRSSSGYQKTDRGARNAGPKKEDFDSLMSSFLKDSDERLTSLKRNTEGKRGGRGGRRN